MTARLSEFATSGSMASDENGGGNSNDSGNGNDDSAAAVATAAAAAERVVMIAFKMETVDDEETDDIVVAAAAGPSAVEQQVDGILEEMVQTTPSPPFSDSNGGKTRYFFSSETSRTRMCVLFYTRMRMVRMIRVFKTIVLTENVRAHPGFLGRSLTVARETFSFSFDSSPSARSPVRSVVFSTCALGIAGTTAVCTRTSARPSVRVDTYRSAMDGNVAATPVETGVG